MMLVQYMWGCRLTLTQPQLEALEAAERGTSTYIITCQLQEALNVQKFVQLCTSVQLGMR